MGAINLSENKTLTISNIKVVDKNAKTKKFDDVEVNIKISNENMEVGPKVVDIP